MDATLPPPSTEPPLRRVGRWQLVSLLGRGAFGSVWRGVDDTGGEVAVKLLEPETSIDLLRVRKEIAALRLVRVPGVVELLDAGEAHGWHYLVTELVAGLPFPGRARGWDELAPIVARLCDTLRGIHAHGVVHRDLKPSNVLVTDEGRVVVLDFGVARGAALGTTVTGSAEIVGTPLYLAPEQIDRDAPVDGRADLYALGLMIWEALAGRRPFAGQNVQELLVARLTREAPPLDVGPEVARRLVAGLLARRPEERPSADAVLAAIAQGEARQLPWLGPRTAVERVVEAVRAGRSIDVGGPAGSGRSRVIAEALAEVGGEPIVLVPAERPLGSFGGRLGEATMAGAEAWLGDRLGAGTVVVADDAARLDRWTRGLLERVRDAGAVVRAVDGDGLAGLTELDLRELFHGPDVVLHLREDAAAALWQRTGGLPARVAEEVHAWVVRGGARWDEGKLRVDRRAIDAFAAGPPLATGRVTVALEEPLDQLLAWIVLAGSAASFDVLVAATGLPAWEVEVEIAALAEVGAVRRLGERLQPLTLSRALEQWSSEERAAAHRRLAAVVGGADRMLHLAAAGEVSGVEDAAVTYARSVLETGAAGKALAALQYAVAEVRAGQRQVRREVATEIARAALVDGSGPALREARGTLERVGAADLASLVAGWEAAGERRYGECQVEGGPFEDEELEAWRVALPIRVAVATDLELAERLIAAVPDTGVLGRRRVEWLGHLRFRQGRYEEAAELHMRAAEAAETVARKANALINAGLAWREGGHLAPALMAFERATAVAGHGRLSLLEGHALVGVRTVRYRQASVGEPDVELIAAVESLAEAPLIAQASLNEAAVAWRSGNSAFASKLAKKAASAWLHPSTREQRHVALSLAYASSGDVRAARALARVVGSSSKPAHRQARALLRLAIERRCGFSGSALPRTHAILSEDELLSLER